MRGGDLPLVFHQPAIGALEQRSGNGVVRAEERLLRGRDRACTCTHSRRGANIGHTVARHGAGTDHQPRLELLVRVRVRVRAGVRARVRVRVRVRIRVRVSPGRSSLLAGEDRRLHSRRPDHPDSRASCGPAG